MSAAFAMAERMMKSAADQIAADIAANTQRAVDAAVERGARLYRRTQELGRLIRIGDLDLADTSPTTRALIVARLVERLGVERTLIARSHWTASLNRVIEIRQCIAGEMRDA